MYSPLIKKVIAKACNVSINECVEVQRLKLEVQRLTQENQELIAKGQEYQQENQELQKKLTQLRMQLANLSDYSSSLTYPVPNNLTSLNQLSSTVVLVNSPNQQLEADQGKPVELLNQLPNGTWHIKVKSGVKVIVNPEALKVLA
ncbi:MAG: hypothetical protein O4752_01910 [Trichodesmium sp. St4_bin8_1]|nr:hypothetical protein [Trichodesmium sp. St4_bin8_1]